MRDVERYYLKGDELPRITIAFFFGTASKLP